MTATPTINLEEKDSDEKIKKLLNLNPVDFKSIIKLKLFEITITEIIAHLISLFILIPYIYLLIKGQKPDLVYDTIAKVVFGAYIAIVLKKN